MFDIEKRNFIKKAYNYTCITVGCVLVNEIITKENKIKIINENFNVMGTNGKLQAFVQDIEEGMSITEKALKRMRHIDKLASKFYPYAEIAIMNKFFKEYMTASDDTLNLLDLSNMFNELTDGYFDIGLGNILSLSEIDKKNRF